MACRRFSPVVTRQSAIRSLRASATNGAKLIADLLSQASRIDENPSLRRGLFMNKDSLEAAWTIRPVFSLDNATTSTSVVSFNSLVVSKGSARTFETLNGRFTAATRFQHQHHFSAKRARPFFA